MKVFKQLAIIVGISLLGDLLSSLFHLPIPGSITGMILLLVFLLTGIVKEKDIKETADFMIHHMSFFFIPACVGVMDSYTLLRGQYVQTLVLIIASTVLVMCVTAWVTQLLGKYTKSEHDDTK
ncbi:MAG: CidA/LrgA family protein [Mangrovibacterium sp.]